MPEGNQSEDKKDVLNQHFWFTATTMGLNGFLITNYEKITYSYFTLCWISFINFYALFLILHRSAYHAGKTKLPARLNLKPQSERVFIDKLKETKYYFKVIIKHIPFVIGEFSGTLFYFLLVLTAYIAFISICNFH